MSAPQIICAYQAINATGWAVVDAKGCTRPASAEEAQRFHQVPSFAELADARRLIPGTKGTSK